MAPPRPPSQIQQRRASTLPDSEAASRRTAMAAPRATAGDHRHGKRDVRRPQRTAGHDAQMRVDGNLRGDGSAGHNHGQNVEVDHWRR